MNRRRFLDLSGHTMLGAGAAGVAGIGGMTLPSSLRRAFPTAAPTSRPRFQGELSDIYAAIDGRAAGDLETIQEYLRQPSISAQNIGVRDCAELTVEYLRRLGCQEAGLIETEGHPVVWGLYDAGAAKTLVNYGMYDTQPINNPERWMDDPREARLVDLPGLGKAILARGAVNTKGPLRAYLNALEAIVQARGSLPVNMIFTIEGEEELGSAHLPQALERETDRLADADGMYFAFPLQGRDGSVSMYLGNKGIVSMEIHSSGASWGRGPQIRNIHGSNAAVVESPTWRLIEALATMSRDNGSRVTIDGYLGAVIGPSADDRELIDAIEEQFDAEAFQQALEAGAFVDDLTGRAVIERYLYTTTWNIDGLWSGYTGDGFATILPSEATAKVDSRIVPNQRSADIVPLARAHLDARGYDDVEVRPVSAYEWSKTSPRDPIAQALREMFRDSGIEPQVWPHLAGSAPFYLYTREPLSLPMVLGGMGHGANQHTFDEYYVVEGEGGIASLDEIEKGYVDFVFRFASL